MSEMIHSLVPLFFMTYLYWMAFSKNNYGASAAISVIGFIVLLAFSILYMNVQMKEETA